MRDNTIKPNNYQENIKNTRPANGDSNTQIDKGISYISKLFSRPMKILPPSKWSKKLFPSPKKSLD